MLIILLKCHSSSHKMSLMLSFYRLLYVNVIRTVTANPGWSGKGKIFEKINDSSHNTPHRFYIFIRFIWSLFYINSNCVILLVLSFKVEIVPTGFACIKHWNGCFFYLFWKIWLSNTQKYNESKNTVTKRILCKLGIKTMYYQVHRQKISVKISCS